MKMLQLSFESLTAYFNRITPTSNKNCQLVLKVLK